MRSAKRRGTRWIDVAKFALFGALAACGGDSVKIAGPIGSSAVQSVTVSPGIAAVAVGQTAQLAASVAVTGTAATTVTWSTSNPAVASISVAGNSVTVTGVAAGIATITATATGDGSKTAAATVTVTAPTPAVQSVSLSSTAASVAVNQTTSITATVAASAGAATTVTFASSNSNIASVTAAGNVVTIRGVAAGTASITATSTADPTKSATAQITVTAAATTCTVSSATAINFGQTVNGALASTDCLLTDGTFADLFRITVSASQTAQISMNSTGVDAVVILYDSNGSVITFDDNSAGGTNARLVRVLAPGTYFLAANAAGRGATGSYTFFFGAPVATCSFNPAGATTITLGQTINGTLASTDCLLSDGSYMDAYRLVVAATTSITVDMSSSVFDTYLGLADANGTMLVEDDDSAGGTNSRVTRTLTAGTYYIIANSQPPAVIGSYILFVR